MYKAPPEFILEYVWTQDYPSSSDSESRYYRLYRAPGLVRSIIHLKNIAITVVQIIGAMLNVLFHNYHH